MPTADEVVTKLQNIITKSNNATGASDTTVNAAVDRLIDGYGSGGGDGGELARSIVERTITEYADDEVTTIGAYAFYKCPELVSVSIPQAVMIGGSAFMSCGSLVSVSAPKVAEISGSNAFSLCPKLAEVYLPALTAIASMSFASNELLAKVDFLTAASIGSNAFIKCSGLVTLILRKSDGVCTLDNTSAFNNTPIASGTGYIYVPSALVEDYKAATNWSTYADQIRAIEDYPEITDPEETT